MYFQNLSFPLLPSPIQSRVASSLCKLDLPAWYTGKSFSTPTTPKWRSGRSPTSWRRKGGTRSAVITPDNLSITGHTSPEPGPSPHTAKKRWSTYKEGNSQSDTSTEEISTIRSSNSFLSYRQPYLGWRTQERLKLNTNYLSSPSQRLACTLLNQGQKHLRKLAD